MFRSGRPTLRLRGDVAAPAVCMFWPLVGVPLVVYILTNRWPFVFWGGGDCCARLHEPPVDIWHGVSLVSVEGVDDWGMFALSAPTPMFALELWPLLWLWWGVKFRGIASELHTNIPDGPGVEGVGGGGGWPTGTNGAIGTWDDSNRCLW